ncbi:MAG TPA: RCC1 repeat-containing protein, partial [Acidimicrobiia bacterium]|nr:RCC1 repeat-containing protein [Acidimicrobiia bacterium]
MHDSSPLTLAGGASHTCAIVLGGEVRCWGSNEYGHLGDGTTTERSTPVTVSGISAATAIAGGGSHSCAIVSGGEARCWGAN